MAHVLNNAKLTCIDELFRSTGEDIKAELPSDVAEVDVEELFEFADHPFRVLDDENMTMLVESIKDTGVNQPGIVRKRIIGGYEIIEGHRRHRACVLAGLKTMPVRVVDWDDDTATAYMALSNLTQRKDILVSEKAKAYRKLRDSIEHQGKKGFLTATQIGESNGDSESTVKRLIRLSYLIEPLLGLVDMKKLSLDSGKNLSYMNDKEQGWIWQIIYDSDYAITVSMEQAKKLRDISENGNLTYDLAVEILSPEKKIKKRSFSMKQEELDEFFTPNVSDEEIRSIIKSLLKDWKAVQKIG